MTLLTAYFKIPWEYGPMLALIDYSKVAIEWLFLPQQEWQEIENLELSFEELVYLIGDDVLNFSPEMTERYYTEDFLDYIQTQNPIQDIIEKYNLLASDETIPVVDTLNSIEDFLVNTNPETEIIVVTLWENITTGS